MNGNEERKRKYVHKQAKVESQRNVTYQKNKKKNGSVYFTADFLVATD